MQKKHLLIALLLLMGSTGFSQRPYYNERPEFIKANSHWIFSNGGIGGNIINFNPIPPEVSFTDTGMRLHNWGYAAISDTATGELLFCTDGDNCWNRNFKIMPNGTALAGGEPVLPPGGIGIVRKPTEVTNQAACIVPVIDDPDKYYVFSLQSTMAIPRLYYSIVDITLDGGYGRCY